MQLIWLKWSIWSALIIAGLLMQSVSSWAATPRIAAGNGHTVALMTDGTVQAWGDNIQGQLGNDTITSSPVPVAVVDLAGPVKAIAAGGTHTVALLVDGRVQAWGNNAQGQLGDGTNTTRLKPVTINAGGTVVAIAAGTSHTLALLDTGVVKAWGANTAGQLGNGNSSMTSSNTPADVINLETAATAITAGSSHSVVILSNNTVKSWGGNAAGQLGNGLTSDSYLPILVSSSGWTATAIAAGGSHTLALLPDGSMKAWGANTYGQLGNGLTDNSSMPVAVNSLGGTAISMVAGGSHSLVLLADGTFRIWGGNGSGQLGTGLAGNSLTPLSLAAPIGLIGIAAGTSHTVTLLANGRIWAWGSNTSGQLGNGSTTSSSTAVVVSGLGGLVTAAGAGDAHTLVLLDGGTVMGWGANTTGQLGTGTLVNSAVPVAVSGLGGTVSAVSAGFGYSMALLSNGTVKAWGSNTNGQLGDGSQTSRSAPVDVTSLLGVTAIAAGYNHSAAILNGTVQTWGNNGSGQLGNNSYTNSLTPVLVSNISTASAIAVGYNFTLALLADGTVRAWGSNGSGQLGTGNFIGSRIPVTVVDSLGAPLANVTAIAAGGYFAVALLQDGTLRAWGYNSNGQLGTGSLATSTRAVAVSSLGGLATAIAAGDTHMIALLADKTLKAWGNNGSGQLGDGTLLQKSTPVTISGVTDVQAISAGDAHSVAILSDGSVRSWGSNAHGQLGDGKGPFNPQQLGFNLDNVMPTVNLDKPGGNYFDSVTVNISCQDDFSGCQGIYFTDDGSTPTWPISGTTQLYTASVTFDQTTTLTYLAVDRAGNIRPATAQNYTLAPSHFPLTIAFTGSGLVQLSSGSVCTTNCSQPITMGTTLSLIPTAAAGGYFTSWSGCDSVSGMVCTVAMNSAKAVSLTFSAYPDPGVTIVAAGTSHTLALLTDSTVKAWGDNSLGQLGIGSTVGTIHPVVVSSLSGTVTDLGAGAMHSLALFADGTVAAWGDNDFGQLGDGTNLHRNLPVGVLDLGGPVRAIAAGGFHTLALLTDGTVIAWGNNASGQLGDGTIINRMRPVAITGFNGTVVAIAAGGAHSLALLADGSLVGWGYNANGQLGDGTNTTKLVPTPVRDLGGPVVRIAAGGSHSLALLADTRVQSWGYNGMGQLGIGSTNGSLKPLTVGLLGAGVKSIAAGKHHSLALQNDGSVKSWGDNTRGQLGNGNTTASTTPVSVSGLSGAVTAITSGEHTSFAINSAGVLRGWGWNAAGQVGNGNTVDSTRAVEVNGVTICNVKISTICYATISEAYAAASSGDTILAQGLAFAESLNANRLIGMTIQGGYAADFSTKSGTTSIIGLTLQSGTLTLDGLTVQ